MEAQSFQQKSYYLPYRFTSIRKIQFLRYNKVFYEQICTKNLYILINIDYD